MRKIFLSVAVASLLLSSTTSCLGSFSLTKKLLSWNQQVNNKYVNEIVFLAFCIVPVYPVSLLADLLVINTIEFWSGSSPVAESTRIIEGNDGKYLVQTDSKGYTITRLDDNRVMRLDFDVDQQTWSVIDNEGNPYQLMMFVDDNHVKVNVGGEMITVETSEAGLWAMRAMVSGHDCALR